MTDALPTLDSDTLTHLKLLRQGLAQEVERQRAKVLGLKAKLEGIDHAIAIIEGCP